MASRLRGVRAPAIRIPHHEYTKEELQTLEAQSPELFQNLDSQPRPKALSEPKIPSEWLLGLPSGAGTLKTEVAFGDGKNVTAYINEYGELILISEGLHHNGLPWYFYLEHMGLTRASLSDTLDAAIAGVRPGMGLQINRSKYEPYSNWGTIKFVHDKWPYIESELHEQQVSVLMQYIISDGTIVQQLLLSDKSGAQNTVDVDFNMDFLLGDSESSASGGQADKKPNLCSLLFGSGGYSSVTLIRYQEAWIKGTAMVFEDGKAMNMMMSFPQTVGTLRVTLEALQIREFTAIYKIERVYPPPDHELSKYLKLIPLPRSSHEKPAGSIIERESDNQAEAQYKYILDDARVQKAMKYIDVHDFLISQPPMGWTELVANTPRNFMFRRHLQRLLTVIPLSVPVQTRQKGDPEVAYCFMNGSLLHRSVSRYESLPQFQYLLAIKRLLDTSDVISDASMKATLRKRICDLCKGHILWCFNAAKDSDDSPVPWPINRGTLGEVLPDDHFEPSSSLLNSVFVMIKFIEYWLEFPDDRGWVFERLKPHLPHWLNYLAKSTEKRSGLWKTHNVAMDIIWDEPSYRQPETVELPEYDLRLCVWIWQALQGVKVMYQYHRSTVDKIPPNAPHTVPSTSSTDEDSLDRIHEKLAPRNLRKLILERFTIKVNPNMADPVRAARGGTQLDEILEILNSIKNSGKRGSLTPGRLNLPASPILDQGLRRRHDMVENYSTAVLATVRCAREADRLSWPARSLVLCGGYDWGFFDVAEDDAPPKPSINDGTAFPASYKWPSMTGTPRLDVWQQSVYAQARNSEGMEAQFWRKPSMYLMALLLAHQTDVSLDSSKTSKEMIETCERVLDSSLSVEGTFPETLDPETKEPNGRLQYRILDSFEIPFALLRERFPQIKLGWDKLRELGKENKVVKDIITGVFDDVESNLERDRLQKIYKKQARETKKSGSMRNRNTISESDLRRPDWLYDYPSFFINRWRPKMLEAIPDDATEENDVVQLMNELTSLERLESRVQSLDEHQPRGIVKEGITMLRRVVREGWAHRWDWTNAGLESKVIIFRTSPWVKPKVVEPRISRLDHRELLINVREIRSPKTEKKKIIHACVCSPAMAAIMCLGVPQASEQHAMILFIERHHRREVFFRDHTNAEANLWITEIHLSFFRHIIKKGPYEPDDYWFDPRNGQQVPPIMSDEEKFPESPLDNQLSIARCVASVHIVGDLADRYWNCHVLTRFPTDSREVDEDGDLREGYGWISEKTFTLTKAPVHNSKVSTHSQRQLLEERLFLNVSSELIQDTKFTIKKLNERLEQFGGSYGPQAYDCFSKSFEENRKRYQDLAWTIRFLTTLIDDLETLHSTGKQWQNRHRSRRVQPRWTEGDEATYGDERRLLRQKVEADIAQINSLVKILKGKLDSVKSMENDLNRDLELKEQRQSNRSAEAVQVFTYATVIFLPLSFVASIFSMAGAPSHETVNSFLWAVLGAVLSTIVVLVSTTWFFQSLSRENLNTLGLRRRLEIPGYINKKFTESLDNGRYPELAEQAYDFKTAWSLRLKGLFTFGKRGPSLEDGIETKPESQIGTEKDLGTWRSIPTQAAVLLVFGILYVIRLVLENLIDLAASPFPSPQRGSRDEKLETERTGKTDEDHGQEPTAGPRQDEEKKSRIKKDQARDGQSPRDPREKYRHPPKVRQVFVDWLKERQKAESKTGPKGNADHATIVTVSSVDTRPDARSSISSRPPTPPTPPPMPWIIKSHLGKVAQEG